MTDQIEIGTLLTRRQVQARIGGVGTSTLYRWVREGSFPPPLKIGGKSVRWCSHEIEAWLGRCPRTIRPAAA